MKPKHLQPLTEEMSLIGIQIDRSDKATVAMVKMLSDRLTRIETAQNEVLKRLTDVAVVLAGIEHAQEKYLGEQAADELDRGQTASAVYGLIKRFDQLEKRLSKTKEPS